MSQVGTEGRIVIRRARARRRVRMVSTVSLLLGLAAVDPDRQGPRTVLSLPAGEVGAVDGQVAADPHPLSAEVPGLLRKRHRRAVHLDHLARRNTVDSRVVELSDHRAHIGVMGIHATRPSRAMPILEPCAARTVTKS